MASRNKSLDPTKIMHKAGAILIGVGLTSFSSANLIFNGSFETNTVVNNGGANDTADGWTTFADLTAAASPDVWDNNGVGGIMPGFAGFFVGMTAYHGTKFASLAGNPPLNNYIEGIESSPFALAANTTYVVTTQLAYYAGALGGYHNPAALTVRIRFGSNPSTIVGVMPANTASATWQLRTTNFQVSTAGSYTLILSAEDSVINYLALDDVTLNPVPEPTTSFALGFGIALACRRRRSRIH